MNDVYSAVNRCGLAMVPIYFFTQKKRSALVRPSNCASISQL